jgi:hypothetical protein
MVVVRGRSLALGLAFGFIGTPEQGGRPYLSGVPDTRKISSIV